MTLWEVVIEMTIFRGVSRFVRLTGGNLCIACDIKNIISLTDRVINTLRDTDNTYIAQLLGKYIVWTPDQIKTNYNNRNQIRKKLPDLASRHRIYGPPIQSSCRSAKVIMKSRTLSRTSDTTETRNPCVIKVILLVPYEISNVNFSVETKNLVSMAEEI
jgi:hypothetical protein